MPHSIAFIGAGASVAFGIPTMAQMVEEFEMKLRKDLSPHLRLHEDIKSKLGDYKVFDIEALITVLRDIVETDPANVLNYLSVHYFSWWSYAFDVIVRHQREASARDRVAAEGLLAEIERFVVERCVVRVQQFEIYDAFFQELLWKEGYDYRGSLKQARIHGIPYKVFTTNYDPGLEAFCRSMNLDHECGQNNNEMLDLTYGNTRLYQPESSVFQIYKLHGSTNWYVDQDKRIRWLTEPARTGGTTLYGDKVVAGLLIYPAQQKYTFREPFYTMFHHLRDCLSTCVRCYIVGYSFRDEDVLGLFQDAMDLNKELRLCLVDPNAQEIASEKFPTHIDRIDQVPREFSVPAARSIP